MNANPVFSLYIPTKILFGCGELRKLATEKLPGKKALIVISCGTSMKKYGYLNKVIELLQEKQHGIGRIRQDSAQPDKGTRDGSRFHLPHRKM